jgi:hypothetical protein
VSDYQFRTFEVDYFVPVWPMADGLFDALFDEVVDVFAKHGLEVEGGSGQPTRDR